MLTITQGEPVRITRDLIARAWDERNEKARLIWRDSMCRGLALVVNPTGMAWSYSYRPRGIDPATGKRWGNRSVTLGVPGTMSAEKARDAANQLKGAVAGGGDPATAMRAKRDEAIQRRASTLGRLADAYAEVLPRRPKLRGSGTASPLHVANEVQSLRSALAEMDAAALPVKSLAILTP